MTTLPAKNSKGHSFSRGYGVILPSSFYVVHLNALIYSTHPPVSVYSTVIKEALFLEKIKECKTVRLTQGSYFLSQPPKQNIVAHQMESSHYTFRDRLNEKISSKKFNLTLNTLDF